MTATPTNRQIRVFISSTFRDMRRERDLLVKRVFPALRRKCAQRFVTLTEVDLRWGITEEQAAEGQVLPLCLAEIERSRPYFLGLLGERYGWIQDTIRPEVIEREPWLKEHVEGRTSVTELEILHGVLNDPAMQRRAFFYFRDPAYVTNPSLADEERRDFVEHDSPAEVEKYGRAEATHRTHERREKLSALKQRIRNSRLPLMEHYANPEALAAHVYEQLDALIDEIYPEAATPDPVTQERIGHEAYAKNKLFACIDRPAHFAALDAFAAIDEHDGKGLVVTGESGGGKTALLAAWARNWVVSHPNDFLFQHYFGATPESASPEGFLRRLLAELKSAFDIPDDIPTDPDKMRESLPIWLAQTVARGRVVLVLDGLNQVQGSDADRRLLFLPRHFPPNVAVIASSLPSPALETLHERGWTEHKLPLASGTEADAMVGEYLSNHARTLQSDLRWRLVTAPGSKNPLFLRTVLDELRQFGSFEQLPQRIAHYLEAGNPRELFLRVLRRWQADFDGTSPHPQDQTCDLVRRAMTHLWAARQGLSEPEWLDLLGQHDEPLPRALWSPLFLALEPHLSQRAGLFAFGHDFLRQAVEEAFVSSAQLQQAAHLAVADFFEGHTRQREMTPRKAAEWPYQLHTAEAWEQLEACLTDIPLFLALYNDKTQWELTGYWHPLRKKGRDMGDCYASAYRRWVAITVNADDYFVPAQLGQFLSDNGVYPAAEPLLGRALAACERLRGPEHADTLATMTKMALLQFRNGDHAGAEPLYIRSLEVSERVLGPAHPFTLSSVNNLATIFERKGDYAGAELNYRQALEGSELVCGPEHEHTLTCMNNLARLLVNKGDYFGAEPLYRQALAAQERIWGPEHPTTLLSVINLAGLLNCKGDSKGAALLLSRALETSERVLGPQHPHTLVCVNNLAEFFRNIGDTAHAEQLDRWALAGRELVLGLEHPDTLASLNNLAGSLFTKRDYAGAEPLFRRALEANEKVLGRQHPDTLLCINNLALLLHIKRDFEGAEPLYRRALEAREQLLGGMHPDTLVSLNNLAGLLETKGDCAGAEPFYRRALEGMVKLSVSVGRALPHLETFARNYERCLGRLGHRPQEIVSVLDELGRPLGVRFGGAGDQKKGGP